MNEHEIESVNFENSMPARELDFLAQPAKSQNNEGVVIGGHVESPFKKKNSKSNEGLSGFKNMNIASNEKPKSKYEQAKE